MKPGRGNIFYQGVTDVYIPAIKTGTSSNVKN